MGTKGASFPPLAGGDKAAGKAMVPAARRVAVLAPLPLERPYEYRCETGGDEGFPPVSPSLDDYPPGTYVQVSVGKRQVVGCVWEAGKKVGKENGPPLPLARLKPIEKRFDLPPLPAVQRRFVEWVAAYTVTSLGTVLRMVLSVPACFAPPPTVTGYRLAAKALPEDLRLTPARQRVIEVAKAGPARPATAFAQEAGVTPGVVRGLERAGVLVAVPLSRAPVSGQQEEAGGAKGTAPVLSPAQSAAAAALCRRVRGEGETMGTVVLDGVTSSGKTEVYFEAVAAALAAGRQALVLVPEITLTAQWEARFAARFGMAPVTWHSDLSAAARRRAWCGVAEGTVKVVVGARSALFLPFADLGLIVVDEEHDASYKQEDGVIYHARDMAVVRGRLGKIPVILVSATPSLETVVNVRQGKYAHLHLPDRHGGADLPQIEAIDLRRTPPPRGGWMSPPLREALAETFDEKGQAMLFLNRRGYAPLTLCRRCGHRFQCPDCTAWLVEHRQYRQLLCHHCGFTTPSPQSCPQCGAEDSLVACGPGVERIAEEAQALFPEARLAVMASDVLAGPEAVRCLIQRIQDHEVDLLVGTQIMAKGHHFPNLTLVGVVDADLGLGGGDLRAGERTYQLLHQVAGRAGRGLRPGRVLLQTHMPDHPVMEALTAGDRDAFLETEIASRQEHLLPPFGRLVALIVSGPEAAVTERVARELARQVPANKENDFRVLGPAPAVFSLLRGRHRYRLLVRARRGASVQEMLRGWLASVKCPAGVRIQVDVDPYSFL